MCVLDMNFDDYEQRLQNAKQLRTVDKRIIHRLLAKTEVLLRRFNGIEKSSIGFGDLNMFILNDWYQLNDKVRFKKIHKSENVLVFETEMDEGGEFGWHYHSDCREICQVIKGAIHDAKTEFDYEQNQTVIYEPGEEHIPVALLDTKLIVIFERKTNVKTKV